MSHADSISTNVWKPTPTFLLRRAAVREIAASWSPGRFLEIGAGTGTLTREFLKRRFHGTCQDLSADTCRILRSNLAQYGERISVTDTIDHYQDESFDYLFAFEVLEHIEADLESLISWSAKLVTGGRLLVTVPAHQSKYSHEDEFVGHVRRYEKAQLSTLLSRAGYSDIRIYSYGFPLTNITGWASRSLRLSGRKRDKLSFRERSIQSGVERSHAIRKTWFLFNDVTLLPFILAQRFFFDSDIGDGYVATGLKDGG